MLALVPTTTDTLRRIPPMLLLRSQVLPCRHITFSSSTDWLHNAATRFYALASASGAVYFAVNFADEGTHRLNKADATTGDVPVTFFVYRACVIQGTQHIYVVALW